MFLCRMLGAALVHRHERLQRLHLALELRSLRTHRLRDAQLLAQRHRLALCMFGTLLQRIDIRLHFARTFDVALQLAEAPLGLVQPLRLGVERGLALGKAPLGGGGCVRSRRGALFLERKAVLRLLVRSREGCDRYAAARELCVHLIEPLDAAPHRGEHLVVGLQGRVDRLQLRFEVGDRRTLGVECARRLGELRTRAVALGTHLGELRGVFLV